MPKIHIPYKFKPREYQVPFLRAMEEGYNRAVLVWHRRSGKDKTMWNFLIKEAFQRKGTYFYFLPTYTQARKIIWNGMDKNGFPFLHHIPKLYAKFNTQEMKVTLENGSIIQLIGTDNIDSIVGTNPVGCVFSEYSLQDPKVWAFIRPILDENGGWAVFNFTPRGKNHAYKLYESAVGRDGWYVEKLTVEDTKAIPKYVLENTLEEVIAEYGDDAFYQQEYMCSFTGSVVGSYYGKFLKDSQKEGRITNVAVSPHTPVHTFWDIGMSDATAIWFAQLVGNEIHVVDYLEAEGEGLEYYVQELKRKGYNYGDHWAPHDIKVREFGSGMSRLETARRLGINFKIVKNIPIIDGIQAVRRILPRMWFDKNRCAQGLDALESYRKEKDEKRDEYKASPYHDWTSHAADAMRYLSVALGKKRRKKKKDTDWLYPEGKKKNKKSYTRVTGYGRI